MTDFIRRIRYLLNRSQLERELASDMEAHREMAERDGRSFGNSLRLREESRDAWGWTWLDRTGQDIRYASRVLMKSPGFTLAAVLTLAVGIGVNVAAFGFFDLFALRPMNVREPETILRFQRRSPQAFATHFSYPAMTFYREHVKSLSAMLASADSRVVMEGREKPIRVQFVTGNYLRELGAVTLAGRTFDEDADTAGADPVVVLSHDLWKAQFGGDFSILGKRIRFNGKPVNVVGVASQSFGGLVSGSTDAWAPFVTHPYFVEGSDLLTNASKDAVILWGRLQPGATPKIAEDELRLLTGELRKQNGSDVWENEWLSSTPGGYIMNAQGRTSRGSGSPSDQRREVYLVAALGGTLVLLILAVACANLGSLLLARGVAREREIAIRVSVGAGNARLVRQLFTESLLLAILGSLAGLALGSVALRALMTATDSPSWLDPSPDWRVIVFGVGLGFAAAILFGLTPALQVARRKHRNTAVRQILIGGQVAASCVLLIVAGLLVRALDKALYGHPGFEYKQVITVDPRLHAHGYTAESARAYLEELRARLQAIPGVQSVSLSSHPPMGRKSTVWSSTVDGRTASVHMNHVDPQFLQTMSIPILRGRGLQIGDSRTIVISESLARRQWLSQDPIGKELAFDTTKYTVVGIAGNARAMAMNDPSAVEAYILPAATDLTGMSAIIRSSVAPESVAASVRQTAKAVDLDVAPEVELMKSAFDRQLRSVRSSALAVSFMGGIALILACLGIVGLVAYAVSQRTKEIGIRMALGAKPSHVLQSVLRQFSTPIVTGSLVGVAGAAGLSQFLQSELYGVSHLDPLAYSGALAVFVATAVLAALVPARRALRVNPLQSLRHY